MSAKEVKFGSDARAEIQKGVNIVADAVKCTLGPRGRHAALERGYGPPVITKDGVSVARAIELKDPLQNIGAQLIKTAASATNSMAGDGTTTATVLSQAIFNEGLKMVAAGHNPVLLKRGLDLGLSQVTSFLSTLSRSIDSEDTLKHVATISTNNDSELGAMIGEVVSNVGEDGVISLEESTGGQTQVTYTEGLQVTKGWLSPAFVTNPEKLSCEFEGAYVILYDDKLTSSAEFLEIIQKTHANGKPLFIIAREVEGEALATLVLNRQKANLLCCAIKAPGFGDVRRDMLEDIAAIVGGKVFDNSNGRALRDAELEDLGRARRIVCTRNTTLIVDGGGSKDRAEMRVRMIKSQMADSTLFDHQKSSLKDRLSKLSGGAAVFRVGGATEGEMRERKDRVEDSLNAVRAAIEMGIVPGGGSALLQASKMVGDFIQSQPAGKLLVEEVAGLNILRNALREPFIQIMRNAGFDHHGPQERILSTGGFVGFDALHGEFVSDMLSRGIIDPVKVVRKGVENAVSASGTLLTTEVCVYQDLSDLLAE
jgi:chaperonin GroEL